MKYLIIILALIAVLSFFWLKQEAITPTNLETKTTSEGGVTIAVTPQMLDETKFRFRITLDTHAGELDTDLTQVSTLIDDQGRIYKPTGWEGDPPGGHHREGVLAFGPIASVSQTLQLTIRQIEGVPERQFVWITNP
ncbi:MAG: hypothetical protein HYT46_01585 [Candidatus Vogelbacteria bacterium]|nr:hypothetical protein [Candidatus Vogelbacteria bacterium]